MLTKTELTRLRKTQEAHMLDRGRIFPFERRKPSALSRARPAPSAQTVETACGLKMTLSERSPRAQESYRQIEADAVLRLPALVEIKPFDEVEVFERYGETVDAPHRYEVIRFESAGVVATTRDGARHRGSGASGGELSTC